MKSFHVHFPIHVRGYYFSSHVYTVVNTAADVHSFFYLVHYSSIYPRNTRIFNASFQTYEYLTRILYPTIHFCVLCKFQLCINIYTSLLRVFTFLDNALDIVHSCIVLPLRAKSELSRNVPTRVHHASYSALTNLSQIHGSRRSFVFHYCSSWSQFVYNNVVWSASARTSTISWKKPIFSRVIHFDLSIKLSIRYS